MPNQCLGLCYGQDGLPGEIEYIIPIAIDSLLVRDSSDLLAQIKHHCPLRLYFLGHLMILHNGATFLT